MSFSLSDASWLRRLLLQTVLMLGCAALARAQESGMIAGRVVDQTGGTLAGVIVELSRDGGAPHSVLTDAGGKYRFDGLAAGPAELTFRLLNFSPLRRTVVVTPDATIHADALLTLALNADVIVTAASTFRNIADVDNPAENLVGIASAASQGAITAVQLEARPLMRAGEVLETVPGMIVSQHSGEGKANQYYLRGCVGRRHRLLPCLATTQ